MEAATSATTLKKKSYTLCVSSEEDTTIPAKEHRRDIESQLPDGPRICGCVWDEEFSAFIIGVFFLLFILFLIIYINHNDFLKSHLPAVRVLRLDVVTAANSSNGNASVTADLAVLIEASGGGNQTELIYREMTAAVATSGVEFGVVRMADARQMPMNSTTLIVAAVLKDAVVGDWAAHDLRRGAAAHLLMINVTIEGLIDMIIEGKRETFPNGYPFKIECLSIRQSAIDAGMAPACSILPLLL